MSNDNECSVFGKYTENRFLQDLSEIWIIVEGNCSYPSAVFLDYEINIILRENSTLSFERVYLRPWFGAGVLKVYSETLDYDKMGTLTMGNVLENYQNNGEEHIEVYGGIVKIGQTYSGSAYSTMQKPIYVYGGIVEISDKYNSSKKSSILSGKANVFLGKDISVYRGESYLKTTVENCKDNGWKENRITLCSESAIEWYKSTNPGILYVYYNENNALEKAWLIPTDEWLIVEGDMEINKRYTGAKNILLKNMSSIVFLNGIHVGANETLRIYAQTDNMKFAGKMEVYGFDGNAAIGGDKGQNGESSGNVYIFGGNVLIKNESGVAIGGGNSTSDGKNGAGGNVHLLGGRIDLIGGEGYAVVGAGGKVGSNGDVENGTVYISENLSALHVREHTKITNDNIAEFFLKSGEILIDNGQTASQSVINETLIENEKDFKNYLLEHPDEIICYIELRFDVQTETPIKFDEKLTVEMNGFKWVFTGEPYTTAFTSVSDKKATFIINGVSAKGQEKKQASFIVYKECLCSFLTAKNCDVIISDLYVENLYTETDGAFLNLTSHYANITLNNVTVYDSHAKGAGGAISIVGDGNYWNIKSVTNTIKFIDTLF
ncbi:MAG: hypothetical protein MJ072_02390, partial [Clostridia bacterium]|nr:hypothetical protein [Clostridia bacterium]